jgi:hypothetical protein
LDEKLEAFHLRSNGLSIQEIKAVVFLAAPTNATRMAITSIIGQMVAKPNSETWSPSAISIIDLSMKADGLFKF